MRERRLEMEANRLLTISQHINPALEWLKKQPVEKKFCVMIKGLPSIVDEKVLERILIKKIKEAGETDIPKEISTLLKIVIDKDKHGRSLGVGYCSTSYRPALIELVKLHKKPLL